MTKAENPLFKRVKRTNKLMKDTIKATEYTYAGLFLITLATLIYELLLTRIFSVTMWYHFAFLAISIVMFGMTVGAVIVYLNPEFFSPLKAKYHLGLSSYLFAITTIGCFLIYIFTPVQVDNETFKFFPLLIIYIVITIPFIFSGICVCIALTKFPNQVSKLYAADLVGAAVGCVLLIYVINFSDGPIAVFITAFIASIAAILFSFDDENRTFLKKASLVSIFLIVAIPILLYFSYNQNPLIRLIWVKGQYEIMPLYQKWNSYSRIIVRGKLEEPVEVFGWGLSSVYPHNKKAKQLKLEIDASAGTVLTKFNGSFKDLDYLKYDVTNIVHYIKPDSSIFIVGAGGGRDILSALYFKQNTITAVEINKDIINTVNNRFGDYTGHLDHYPNVNFIADEARSFISRQKDNYDIIQISLIDTWAATAAGAFVLSENSIYTLEAWQTFFQHLSNRGILSCSRYYSPSLPDETLRITTLAIETLKQAGIKDPEKHIILLRNLPENKSWARFIGVSTLLVSKKPFSSDEINFIETISNSMNFELIITPEHSRHPDFKKALTTDNLKTFYENYPINITPPTDDSPFFFNMIKLKDVFKKDLSYENANPHNQKAVNILFNTFLIILLLTFLCIIIPLLFTIKKIDLKGATSFFAYFSLIGLGFMFIEIAQLQRLIIFLGHPTYALSIVLFTLLISCGIGSFLTSRIKENRIFIISNILLGCLLLSTLLTGLITPFAMNKLMSSINIVRIIVSITLLFPMGVFLGMAFPFGLNAASKYSIELTPWLWGLNGGASVLASVIAIIISINTGISATFYTGITCYIIASIIFLFISTKYLKS